MKSKDEIIQAAVGMDFHPVKRKENIDLDRYVKIPMTEFSGLGAMFAEMSPAFRTVTMTTRVNTKGLYRCVFPEGVSGYLADFKNGSGQLGTIINKNGIAGQAHWHRVHSIFKEQTFSVPVSPLNMFMAAAIIGMDRKLDQVQKLGEEILNYQKEKDKAEQEANFEELLDVYDKYKYNLEDKDWQRLKYNDVQNIRRSTLARMKQLHTQIEKSMDKHDLVHNTLQTNLMVNDVQKNFQMYRLADYMYSFATFLEVILQGNFSRDYLNAIYKDINEQAEDYRNFYMECHSKLEHSSKTTVGSKLLQGFAKLSGDAGRTLHKIPIVEKGPLDEALVDAEKSVNAYSDKMTERTLQEFTDNMQSGAEQFSESVQNINSLYNSPMEVLVDGENVYLKTEKA